MTYRFGFLLEQALGHVTHADNLRRNITGTSGVTVEWGLVPFEVAGLASRIPLYKSNWTVRAGLRARAFLNVMARRGRLDALFFHTQTVATLASDWIRRIPSVVSLDATPRQMDALGAAYNHAVGPGPVEQVKWQLHQRCFHAARHLVTWSAWTKRSLVGDYGITADKITVIPPGVNPDEWTIPRAPHDRPAKILFVGGDLVRKNGHLLIDAWRTLRDLGTELHLVTRTPVAAEPGLFVYNNLTPNSAPLRQLYRDADIFALPSAGDCLPMALMEAGAAGLPLVSTDVAAIPEIVQDGQTGRVVAANDATALAGALRTLAADGQQRYVLGQNAAALVRQSFNARTNSEHLLDLLRATAAGGRS